MKLFAIITMIALALTFFVAGPMFSILAINTLFGTGINLTLGSWFAMLWVHIIIAGGVQYKKSGK